MAKKLTIESSHNVIKQSKFLRAFYTLNLFLGHFAFGLVVSQMGSAMVDLRYIINNNIVKEVASTKAITLQSTFLSAGALIGGICTFSYKLNRLSAYLNRQLVSGILLLFFGIANSLIPQISQIYLLYIFVFISGIGGGNWLAIAITWLIEMWNDKLLAGCLQALQLSYGIGTIFGPVIAGPFLFGHMNGTVVELMNETVYWSAIEERRTSLMIPYLISGTIVGTAGLSLCLMYISGIFRYQNISQNYSKTEEVSSKRELAKKPLEDLQNKTRIYVFLTFIFCQFFAYNLSEFSFATFLETFLQSLTKVTITATEAAHVAAIYATTYTIGRAANIAISMIVNATYLLFLHYTLGLVGFMCFLWSSNITLLWIQINAALIGYAFSAIIPAMYTFISLHSIVDDRRNALYSMAMHTPSIFTPLLIGPYIDHFPVLLLYLDLSFVLLALAIFLLVRFKIVL